MEYFSTSTYLVINLNILFQTKISTDSEKQPNSPKQSKRFGRGAVESGLTHECGVFGAMACGDWPSQVEKSLAIVNA